MRSTTHSENETNVVKNSLPVELFAVLLLTVFFTVFGFQVFQIPSGSMRPTLLVGDYVIVSKFSYGFSGHTLPWS